MNLAGLWRFRADDSPDFHRPDFDDSSWETMRLPRNWFLAGLDHHGAVWFRCEFRRRTQAGRFATLRFDGVDYFADVYLNGELLGHHCGYFEPFAFDVTRLLRSGKNLLAVRVDSPYETPGLDGWHLRKKLIKGVLNHHDCRPGGGWEPVGQSYNTGGIWNRVSLEEHGAVTIERLLLRADLNAKAPVLHVDVTVRNRAAKLRRRLEVRCAPENFKGKAFQFSSTVELPKGDSLHRLKVPLPEVVRWNPWDRGDPNLYTVTVTVEKASRSTAYGFRTVGVDEGFNWTLNGERYFPRGSNYLASQWLAETLFPEIGGDKNHPFGPRPGGPGSWFEGDVALARQANLNLLRVHAHVLPPEFHAACDRAGMLVWQDFPLQWGYSDEADFQDEAERQIGAMVTLLYNHPSVAAWCCHNESPSDAPWMAGQAGGLYDPAHNRDLDERLARAVKKLDPARYVHKNSGTGDGHAYPGWYFGHRRDFKDVPGAPFVTEYGAQGLPGRENLLRTLAAHGPDGGYGDLVRFKTWLDSSGKISPTTRTLVRFGTALYSLTEKHPALKPVQNWMRGWGIKVERSPYRNIPAIEAT
jgi:beta-mannosidase